MLKNIRNILLSTKQMKCSFRFSSGSTIYALSSGHGKCGVAVIRVSGPQVKVVLEKIGGFSQLPKPRYAVLRNLIHPHNGEIIDKGLVLWFPGPKSFTGEDSCEFQVHGGLAVVNGIFSSLDCIPSLRIADPGEFTKRAFANGKLDLTEVEGLADLLNAETEVQRKQAFLQSQGALSELYEQWKRICSREMAHFEAIIDFEETENIDENQNIEILKEITALNDEIEKHLTLSSRGEILRHGVKTVILGEPNVGKSSLMNILCRRPVAIVTPISGTTTDVIESRLDISGYPLILMDTAGVKYFSSNPIEFEGIKRTMYQVENADLIIIVLDALAFELMRKKNSTLTFKEYQRNYLKKLGVEDDFLLKKPSIIVLNKIDICHPQNIEDSVSLISCKTENGIEALIRCLTLKLKEICGEPSKEHPVMNKERHRKHLQDCSSELRCFIEKMNLSTNDTDIVILVEHLRQASKHLGKLVGATTTEELLQIIFRDFCIGK